MLVYLFFASILLTCALSGFLAVYAWRQRNVSGARAYAGILFSVCLLALAEILSMFSPTPAQALFWFQVRYPILAAIPVLWLVFALEYRGRKALLSTRLLAGMFVVPVITQIMFWSNSLHGLWVRQEVGFHRNGPFWIAETGTRLPGLGFLTHSLYSLILLLAGIVFLLITAWRMRQQHRGQALLVAGSGFTAFVFAFNSVFNLIPQTEFNFFTPGIGLSILLITLAVLRFQFLKRANATEADSQTRALEMQMQRSLAVFLLIFVAMTAGIAAVGYLSYQNYERQFRAQVESNLSSIAALKVSELQDWCQECLADAELLYRNPSFSSLVQRYLENPADAQARAELQVWLDDYQVYREYNRVFLLDVGGVERISSLATSEPVAAHLAQDVAAVLSTGQVTFLDFHRDTADGPIFLSLLVPIFARQDNRPLGVLVLRIDPNVYLYPYIQQWPIPSASAETLLVRREGTDIVFLNELRFQTGTALNLRFPLEHTQLPAVKTVLGLEGIVEGVDYRGVPVIADGRAVPGSPWFLVAKVDIAEVYAPLQERLWQTVAFFGVLIVASGAALGLVWWHQRLRYYQGQVAAAQALHQAHAQLNATLGALPDLLFEVDRDGRIHNFHAPQPELLFVTPEKFLGKTIHEVLPADAVQVIAPAIAGAAATGRHLGATYMLPMPNGPRWYELSIAVKGVPHMSTDRLIVLARDITERKQMTEMLRESQAQFQDLYENAPNAYFSVGVDGHIRRCNRRAGEMLGYAVDELVGQSRVMLYADTPHGKEKASKVFQRFLAGETVTNEELQMQKADGTLIWVSLTVNAIRDVQGQVVESRSMVVDITERKRAENLICIQRDLGLALNTTPRLDEGLRLCVDAALKVSEMDCGGIYLVDETSGALDLVSHSGFRPDFIKVMSHYDADSANAQLVMAGKPIYFQYPKLGEPLDEALQSEGLRTIAAIPIQHEGQVIGCLNVASHTLDEVPISSRFALEAISTQIGSTITHLQSEKALRESEANYRELADSITDVFFAFNKDLRYTYWNRASEKLTGISAKDAIGKSLLELFPDTPQTRRAEKVYLDVLKTQQPQSFVNEYQFGGKEFFFESSVYPSKDGLSIFTKDITEQKLAEERIKAALEEKEALLREVHHRVKNNMQVISSLLSLQERKIKDEGYSEMLKESQDRIKSMSLVHEKLYQSVNLADINFGDYIKSLANSLFRSYGTKGKIALKVECEDVRIPIDSAIPCGLILNELISNSLKHAFPEDPPLPLQRRGGEINIFLRSTGDEIELVVSDNGVGIPEGLDFRNTESLGLHLVTILAEGQLHGKIELERTAGTSFRIRFDKKGSACFRK